MPPISETLAVFAHKLRLEQVPYDVRERAKHLILDAIGCALAARGEAFAMTFAEATRSLSTPSTESPGSGVMGFDQRLPLRDACLLNAMLMSAAGLPLRVGVHWYRSVSSVQRCGNHPHPHGARGAAPSWR